MSASRNLLALTVLFAGSVALARDSEPIGADIEEVEPADAPPDNAHPPGIRMVPERWTVPTDVIGAVRAVEDEPVGIRLEAATLPFLDLPYLNEAAGEGEGVDPDPPARFVVDRVSVVESTLSPQGSRYDVRAEAMLGD